MRNQARLVEMVPVKVAQEAIVQNVALRNLLPHLRTIPLPVNQNLETASTPVGTQDALDSVGWATLNSTGEKGAWTEGPHRLESEVSHTWDVTMLDHHC